VSGALLAFRNLEWECQRVAVGRYADFHFFSRMTARSGDPVISSTITTYDDSVAHSFECKQFDTAVSLCLKPLAYP